MNKLILIILDGWGLRIEKQGNAIKLARTPNFDHFWQKYPHAVLRASGEAIGLPNGQIGTSEVNHMVIGAGRLILQSLVRINKAIEDGSFFKNKAFIAAFDHVKKYKSALHIKGLVSPGGVHSHQNHLYALLRAAKTNGLKKIYIHVFTDGRDTLPESAKEYVGKLEKFLKNFGVGRIASVVGRYYAMDRDKNFERTDRAFELLTKGRGKKYKNALEAIEESYKKSITDEFIKPCLIDSKGVVKNNDAVVFINFRNDRPRQLVERFLEKGPKNLCYVTMTQYAPHYSAEIAFSLFKVKNSLGEIISKAGLKQLRITETEKFAHLTFFLNCKREEPFEGEDRIMLNSYSNIKTHDERPEMRVLDIAKEVVQAVKTGSHQVIFTNLCNGDMVGHTGNIKAAIKGIEAVDGAIGKIVKAGEKKGFDIIVTADHGNAEKMRDEKGNIITAHTANNVPFILISRKYKKLKTNFSDLTAVAPTALKLLNIPKPVEMTRKNLV